MLILKEQIFLHILPNGAQPNWMQDHQIWTVRINQNQYSKRREEVSTHIFTGQIPVRLPDFLNKSSTGSLVYGTGKLYRYPKITTQIRIV
jgi:urease accessory protein UreE